jgi:hypothetical protein
VDTLLWLLLGAAEAGPAKATAARAAVASPGQRDAPNGADHVLFPFWVGCRAVPGAALWWWSC